jgi:hypothetical protein
MNRTLLALICSPLLLPLLCAQDGAKKAQTPGYKDTPVLPSGWHVHDSDRPHPTVVTPAPAGDPVAPPADAIVLFDGKDLSTWTGRDDKASWKLADGHMEVNGTGDIQTRDSFGDCQLHVEFATPVQVRGESQGRGNSGVFLFGRYEVQVLDSYENVTYADGQCASLYGQYPPLVNACRKPGEWQTYDILFRAPRFDANGKCTEPATITVIQNGIAVHVSREYLGDSSHRSLPKYNAHGEKGPIRLQDHGDLVRFRNIWIRPLPAEAAAGPAKPTEGKRG